MSRAMMLAALLAGACKQQPSHFDDVEPPLVIDGEWDEPAWNAVAQRASFTDVTGTLARPYSELRVLRTARGLAIGLYAADEDIRATDTFDVAIERPGAAPLQLAITADGAAHTRQPSGALAAPPVGARAAVDHDGTLDAPADDDEEWVVELELPAALVAGATAVTAHRCDHPKAGGERCGAARMVLLAPWPTTSSGSSGPASPRTTTTSSAPRSSTASTRAAARPSGSR